MEEEIKTKKFPRRSIFVLAVALLILGAAVYCYPRAVADRAVPPLVVEKAPRTNHLAVPSEVRAIYITAEMAGNEKRFSEVVNLGKSRGINSLVVDLKNENGSLAFLPKNETLKAEIGKNVPLGDLGVFADKVHGLGLYLIARMPVFEDPNYAIGHPAFALKRSGGKLWTDANGLAWLDPASEDVWKYNSAVATEAYTLGFDEIQFDYIRFATDGVTSAIVFPVYDKKKETYRQVISRFFSFLDSELRAKGIPISADVFGFVTWHQSDLGIGQWYDDAIRTMDYVSPMVYPSHYPSGVLQFKNPAAHPYEIIADSLKKGNEVISLAAKDPDLKLATQRPWLQAFDMGAKYTPELILAEVKASRDNNASGFMFWNARNDYSNLPVLTNL